jgi:outer membrane receptor protein involved in Fe transport
VNTYARTLLFSTLFLLLQHTSAQLIFAQTGSITGVVVDAETGETLIGANVVIEGTLKGAQTDLDGRYTLANLEAGTYSLVVSYISFTKQTITGVVVVEGQATRLDIELQPESELLEEVVVTAEAVLNNEAGLLRQRQKSISFSDAISSETLTKSGSGDAAAALTKVTGASVVGGKYVYVRGLGDRYASIQLNGIELPSTDPDRKTFQLDLIPSSLLDNINTIKTFTPDKPGSFSGGIVDINTKTFPDQLQFNISFSGRYNTQSSFIDDFLSGEVSDTDFIGVDDGQRDIPEIFLDPNLVIPPPQTAQFSDSLATIINNTSRSFNGQMTPIRRSIPIDHSFSVSLGNKTSLFGKELGYLGSITYGRNYTYYDDGEVGRFNLVDPENSEELTILQQYNDERGTDEVNIGGLLTLQYKLSRDHRIGLNYFQSQSGSNFGREQNGIWPDELGFPEENVFQQRTNNVTGYTERSLRNFQGSGEHYFPNVLNAKVDWTVALARTQQEEPDLRFVSYFRRQLFEGGDTTSVIRTAGFAFPSRIFRDLIEDNTSFVGNLEIPLQVDGRTAKIKMGGSYSFTDRSFRENFYFIDPSQAIFTQLGGDVEEFFQQDYRGVVDTTFIGGTIPRYRFGNIVTDNTQPRNNYDGTTEISGGYFMVELPVTEKLRFVGGARLERAVIDIVSFDTTTTIQNGEEVRIGEGRLDNTDLLPSINFIYALNDNSNVRLALTRTIARPNQREIAPFASFEFIGDFQKLGNVNLERTLITNYDARWELFPRPGEVIALSVFYKQLENPIELGFAPTAIPTNAILQYQNVDEAEITGLEFEVRKNLDFISQSLEKFSVGGNLSLVNSSISIPPEEIAQRPDTTDTKRVLQGQSPYIINVNFGYDDLESGLSAGFYFNVFGERLSNVGFGLTPDVFEKPRPQLDFVGSKDFNNLSFSLKVQNILNPETRFVHEFRDTEAVFAAFRTGINFSVGVSYGF